MISKGLVDSSVPMLLANHPNVQFNSYCGGPDPAAQGGP
jgi:hypothetical protein